MWVNFTNLVSQGWHYLEERYGYHEVLRAKEWIGAFSFLLTGMILMHFINYWFFFQHHNDETIDGLSAMRIGGKTFTNPRTHTELLDSNIGIIYLKLFPHRRNRPKYPKFARNIIYLIIFLLIVFTIVGIITADIVTLPYGDLKNVY
ncbi:hypothetical protein Desaci_1273 [Desulfosporosinus acidiphilus SJ4]|uniref:Uncharacterized protein n=2 Tax=Desulfosporosinus TaxID=79206 RepID=I4D3C6_DESAJ|nr:hypothetical protein Desaci_1273 [Desulfosporosinus acidiphilus SJ4]